jgi:hypothetical protein
MTRRHRRWHLVVWLVVGPLLLAGLVVCWLARPEVLP